MQSWKGRALMERTELQLKKLRECLEIQPRVESVQRQLQVQEMMALHRGAAT
jgi:hypothetical protein